MLPTSHARVEPAAARSREEVKVCMMLGELSKAPLLRSVFSCTWPRLYADLYIQHTLAEYLVLCGMHVVLCVMMLPWDGSMIVSPSSLAVGRCRMYVEFISATIRRPCQANLDSSLIDRHARPPATSRTTVETFQNRGGQGGRLSADMKFHLWARTPS